MSVRRFPDDFGPALYAKDIAEVFSVTVSRVYQLDAEGALMAFENRPRIGRKSWSRDRLVKYFAGELRGLTGLKKPA